MVRGPWSVVRCSHWDDGCRPAGFPRRAVGERPASLRAEARPRDGPRGTGNGPPARLLDFDDVVQLPELVGLDVLVVRVGQPAAVDDEAVAVAAGGQRELGGPLAGAAGGGHVGQGRLA